MKANTGSGFSFLFYIQSEVTTISNARRTPFHPTATRILTGLGFVLGQGVAVAAKVLVKSSRCDTLQNREKLPGAARRGKPGI